MQQNGCRTVGRPVRVVSIGFRPGPSLTEIAHIIDAEGARGADVMILPETCNQQMPGCTETLDGPFVRTMAGLARKHHTYVICPIDRNHGGHRLNSAVVLNRSGEIVCVYDKVYPFPAQEFAIDPPVKPGSAVRVFEADFGRAGIAICFDVNWPHLWESLADQGAELVLWPSAYSAGRALQAHATAWHYPIVSATYTPDCLVYDIDGQLVGYDRASVNPLLNVTRVTLDLDRCIFHMDENHPRKLDKLLEDHGAEVVVEKWLPLERWFVLRANRPGASARKLAREYGLEELRDYITRSRYEVDALRAAS